MPPERRVFDLLLVEDNPGDVELTREALRECALPLRTWVAHDGVEALAFLRRTGAHAEAPRPALVLLDLNLPRLDGRGVLAEMKGDAALRDIPVVVLTSSQAAADVRRVYGLHANCCVAKPVELDRYFDAVGAIARFWLETVQLPGEG
jgi:chemotaxis family two-component system response regulator Rcp1